MDCATRSTSGSKSSPACCRCSDAFLSFWGKITHTTSRRPQKRKTPAPEGTRVYRRMGEGLGAGGHSTRRQTLNVQDAGWFLPGEIIFAPWLCGRGGGGAR